MQVRDLFLEPHPTRQDLVAVGAFVDPALATRRPLEVLDGIRQIDAADIEADLANMVTASGGIYIVQHGIDMIRLGRGEFGAISPEAMELHRSYIAPHLPTEAFKQWCRRFARAFTDVRQWLDELRQHDFAVGTRFHGAMLAVQAGTPAGCIAHDSRVHEMCQTMGIPVVLEREIETLSMSGLKRRFRWDSENYRKRRAELRSAYSQLLTSAGIKVTRRLGSETAA